MWKFEVWEPKNNSIWSLSLHGRVGRLIETRGTETSGGGGHKHSEQLCRTRAGSAIITRIRPTIGWGGGAGWGGRLIVQGSPMGPK